MKTAIGQFLALGLVALLSACGSSSSDGPDTSSCPNWNLDDSMTYMRTETVSGVSTDATTTDVVTERSADSVTLSDDTTTKIYSIVSGRYIPVSVHVSPDPDIYTSITAFCPPPPVGARYEYEEFVSPDGRVGDYVSTTETVTAASTESVSIPAGNFTARKIVLEKSSEIINATITRYYVGGIGVVKEVEEILSENTTITDVLTSYSYQ